MTAPRSELRIRRAARALILTPTYDVLLVRFAFPARTVWALPGGGLEAGERHEDALRRELAEELGMATVAIGPHVWNRRQVIPFPDGAWDGQEEHIHLVPVPARFEPHPQLTWPQLHQEYVAEFRWWTPDELAQSQGTVFAPRRLPALLEAVRREGPPSAPIDVGE